MHCVILKTRRKRSNLFWDTFPSKFEQAIILFGYEKEVRRTVALRTFHCFINILIGYIPYIYAKDNCTGSRVTCGWCWYVLFEERRFARAETFSAHILFGVDHRFGWPRKTLRGAALASWQTPAPEEFPLSGLPHVDTLVMHRPCHVILN
jgi:hypothetical protein